MQISNPIDNLNQLPTRSHSDLQNLIAPADDHTQYVPVDGSRPAKNIQSGLDANKPASPAVGDVYIATDTSTLYACYSLNNWTSFVFSNLTQTILASESISPNQVVYLASGTRTATIVSQLSGSLYAFETYVGQNFYTDAYTTQIVSISISVYNSVSGTIGINVYATDANGFPTGSSLGSASASVGGGAFATFTFGTPISVSASTQYVVTMYCGQVAGAQQWSTASGDPYTSGTFMVSADNVTWTNVTGYDAYFSVACTVDVTGTCRLAHADTSGQWTTNVIGISSSSAGYREGCNIVLQGVIGGFSGLTVGSIYYLSNTNGAISTTAGTVSKVVGLAISATQIMIKNIT